MDDLLYDSTENDELGLFDGDDAGENDNFFDSIEGESDDFDSEDEFGPFDDSESAESRRSRARNAARRRRAMRAKSRARKLAMQRGVAARRAAAGRRRRAAAPPTPRRRIAKNRANIRKVGLESAVKSDVLAGGLRSHSKRIGGTENALSASKVVEELTAQFPEFSKNKLVKTGLPLAPLLFLKPPKKGSGVQSIIMDPRVWGPVLAAGAALFNEFRDNDTEPQQVSISPNSLVLAAGNSFRLNAVLRNKAGKIVGERKIVWASLDAKTATVNENTGEVKAIAGGDVTIVATDTASALTNAVTIKVT